MDAILDAAYRSIFRYAGGIIGEVRGGPSWEGSVPLPSTRVLLFAPAEPDGTSPNDVTLIRETETDCTGRFHFFQLEPGLYYLAAEAPEFHPERVPVEVEPGQVAKHRFLLHPE